VLVVPWSIAATYLAMSAPYALRAGPERPRQL
jgi:hypothetical protein